MANDNFKEQQEQIDNLNESIKEQSKLVQEQSKLKQEYIKLMGDEAEYLKAVLAAQKKLEIAQKTGIEDVSDLKKEYEELQELLSDTDKAILKYSDDIEAQNKALRENQKELEKRQKSLEDEKKSVEEANKVLERRKKILQGMGGAVDSLTKSNISQMFSLKGLANAMIDFMFMQKETQVELARTTGAGTAFKDNLLAVQRANKDLGLTMKETGQILGNLSTGMARFNALSDTQQNAIAGVSARFMRLGADSAATSEMFDRLNFAFGMTGNAALEAASDIERLSDRVGRPIDSVIQDLNSLGPELSRFGQSGLKVFEKLAVQARELGLSVKQAFDMSELFDTFEGAANVAGRLNAQLGLQLNSVELMKASSEDRIELLRQEFALQGKNINTMGRRQQQMIASILQTDVESARRLLGDRMDISRFQQQRTPEKRMDDFITVQERVAGAMEALMLPLAEVFSVMASGIMRLVGIMADYAPQALGLLGAIALARGAAGLLRGRGMGAAGAAGAGGAMFRKGGMAKVVSKRTGKQLYGAAAKNALKSGSGAARLTGAGIARGVGGAAFGGLISGGMEYMESGSVGRAAGVGGGALAGGAAGAALGAKLGVIGGPLGMAVGAAVLGGLGSILGGEGVKSLMGKAKPKEKEQISDANKAMKDFQRVVKDLKNPQTRTQQEIVVPVTLNVDGNTWAKQTVKTLNMVGDPTAAR